MDAVAELGSEHVVDEPVLGDPGQPFERGRADHGVEVMAVAGDLGHRPGNARLDPLFELLWGCGHAVKRSHTVPGRPPLYFVKQ